jgi:surfactin synthase thioesterase subunit
VISIKLIVGTEGAVSMNKKIFCLPYAGGSAFSIYGKWRSLLIEELEIVPLELPGRGARIFEDHFKSIEEAVDDGFRVIKKNIENCSYGLWGHSMGGIIAYELGRKIAKSELQNPTNIIISGLKPLHSRNTSSPIHLYNDNDFINTIINLNGTPKEVFDNREMRDLYLPILRNDFKVIYDYDYHQTDEVLSIPLTAIMGKNEDIKLSEFCRWKELTSSSCEIISLEGDHFFINRNLEAIANILRRILNDSHENISYSNVEILENV